MTDTTPPFPADDQSSDDFEIDLGGFVPEAETDEVEIDLGALASDEEPEQTIDLSEPEEAKEGDAPEFDEETRAALERLREDLADKYGDWYVVHTYSGMENRVKQNLDSRVKTLNMEDYIFETVVPTEDVVEIRNNTRKTVTRSVLPGYVLVRMELTDDSWAAVRHTPSVTGFVGHANTPIPLGLDEVEKMLTPSVVAKVQSASAGTTARRKRVEVVDFTTGDSVTVVDGPFTGVHATITEINPHSQRLKALVLILGRETPVDLEFRQVEKAD